MNYVMLKDVCAINMGQSPDSNNYNDTGDGVPFFQGNADFGERYPVTRKWCSVPTKMAAPDDILISVRAPIGAMNYAKEDCCIGRGLAAITPDKSKVSPAFIFWLLKGKNAELNSKGTGSTFKAISRKVLEETMVPEIPLEKQKEFSEILERVYGVIQARKEELKKIDDLIRARFVEMFGDRYVNDKNWNTTKLGDSISFNNGKAHEQVVDEKGAYILVTSRAIASDFKDVRRTNELLFPLHKNDIVMVMSDVPNGKALAKCQLIEEDNKYTLNQRICSFDNYNYNPVFLLFLLSRHPYFLSFDDGNGQTNLRKNDILNCELIVPPMELQKEFASFVEQVNKSKIVAETEHHTAL